MISTDIAIVGAGPVGLFAIFECGLLKMRCHLIDYLPQAGGQLSEIYPKKPIYDIPGYPTILAQELVDHLLKQAEPFHPTYTFGERIEILEKRGEGDFLLTTNMGTQIHSKVVVIAGGLGCFEPRKPETEGCQLKSGRKWRDDHQARRDQPLVDEAGVRRPEERNDACLIQKTCASAPRASEVVPGSGVSAATVSVLAFVTPAPEPIRAKTAN